MLVLARALDQLVIELLALGAVGVAGDLLGHVGVEGMPAPLDGGRIALAGQIGDGSVTGFVPGYLRIARCGALAMTHSLLN
jgi:hypothetical protein